MTRFFLIVFGIALLTACKPGIPKDIIQPDEMEKILFDIHLIDGYVSSIPTPDSAKKIAAPIYKGIFKKYGVDSATHAKSMTYYYQRPDLLSKMYDRISEKMSKAREQEIKKQEKEAKLAAKKEQQRQRKIADSIKSAVKVKKVDTVQKSTGTKQLKTVQKTSQPAKI